VELPDHTETFGMVEAGGMGRCRPRPIPIRGGACARGAVFGPWDDPFTCAVRRMLARPDGDATRPSLSLVPRDLIAGDSGALAPI